MIDTVKTAVKNPAYRSVATYIFTNFFSKGVSFILIPLFTNPKYLTPTDNGLLSLFSSNMILLAPFISLGMIQSSAADYFKKPKSDFSASLTGNFFIGAILALLATLSLFIFQGKLLINTSQGTFLISSATKIEQVRCKSHWWQII